MAMPCPTPMHIVDRDRRLHVKLRKRLDLVRDAEQAVDRVPGLIVEGWEFLS